MPVTPLCALISVGVSEFTRCSHVLDETAGIEFHFASERAHGFDVEFFFGRCNGNNFRHCYAIACNRYVLPQNRIIDEL
jgi:hypothetical protein